MTVSELGKLPISEIVAISPKLVSDLIADWRAMRDTLLSLEYDGELSAIDTLNHLRLKP